MDRFGDLVDDIVCVFAGVFNGERSEFVSAVVLDGDVPVALYAIISVDIRHLFSHEVLSGLVAVSIVNSGLIEYKASQGVVQPPFLYLAGPSSRQCLVKREK